MGAISEKIVLVSRLSGIKKKRSKIKLSNQRNANQNNEVSFLLAHMDFLGVAIQYCCSGTYFETLLLWKAI